MIQLLSLISPTNSYRHGRRNNLLVILFYSKFTNGFRCFGQLFHYRKRFNNFNFCRSFRFGFCFYNLWGCFRLKFRINNRFVCFNRFRLWYSFSPRLWFGWRFGFTYFLRFNLFNKFVFEMFFFNYCFSNICIGGVIINVYNFNFLGILIYNY